MMLAKLNGVDLSGLEHVLFSAASMAGRAAHLARCLSTLRDLPGDKRVTCRISLPVPAGGCIEAVLGVTVEEIRARLRAEIEAAFVDSLDGLDQAREAVEATRTVLRHGEDAA